MGLGIQSLRDVSTSLMPSARHGRPEDPGGTQAWREVASLLRALRRADVDLPADQLERAGGRLVELSGNASRLGSGSAGVSLRVGLVETLVDSSPSWDVNRRLRLARLLPRDGVHTVVDLYRALPAQRDGQKRHGSPQGHLRVHTPSRQEHPQGHQGRLGCRHTNPFGHHRVSVG